MVSKTDCCTKASEWIISQLVRQSVLCWAKGGEPAYQGFLGVCLFGQENAYSQTEVQDMLKQLAEGNAVDFDETKLDPQKPFYILGLAPNAARLSVHFFQRNSFGAILKNIQKHYRQTEISYDPFQTVPLWKLLSATVNQNSKDKLRGIMDEKKDSLRFYYLGNQYQTKIEHFGIKSAYDPEGVLII